MKHFLILTIAATFASAAHAQSTFRDVPDNHWAAAAIRSLAEAGIIIGRPASEAPVSSTRSAKKQDTKIVWGKAIDGLQAGTSPTLGDRPYKIGEVASFNYSVRNVRKSSMKIEVPSQDRYWFYTVSVVDSKDKLLPFEAQLGLLIEEPYNFPIATKKNGSVAWTVLQLSETLLSEHRN